MMANLDANALVSVKENFTELAEKMNSPDQCKFLWNSLYATKASILSLKKKNWNINPA